jgi:1-carboxybiuret hydrolase subunit AtzG-like protein
MTRAEWGVDELPEPILDKLIDASAAALGLPVEPEWKPAIKANLAVTLRLANMVATFSLPDEAEPAPIFEA